MSAVTKIQWSDRTWNPVRGCSRVSPGCDNCYAMRQAHRFNTPSKLSPFHGLTVLRPKTAKRPGVDWSGRLRFVHKTLGEPLRWRKPQRIFVNSMSDLFHEALDNEDIAAVFGVMAACPQHTFQVLTKRHQRAREWFAWVSGEAHPEGGPGPAIVCGIEAANRGADVDYLGFADKWPLPNVWLGVSAENQKTADERIPALLSLPAAVRFISAEPLLARLDLSRYMWPLHWSWDARFKTPEEAIAAGAHAVQRRQALVSAHAVFIDWVIVGGESGPGARPFDVCWADSLVRQCADAGVACFVKQLGRVPFDSRESDRTSDEPHPDGAGADPSCRLDLVDRKGGDMSEWPEDLRVREFPAVRT